jgi:hypothetical protein
MLGIRSSLNIPNWLGFGPNSLEFWRLLLVNDFVLNFPLDVYRFRLRRRGFLIPYRDLNFKPRFFPFTFIGACVSYAFFLYQPFWPVRPSASRRNKNRLTLGAMFRNFIIGVLGNLSTNRLSILDRFRSGIISKRDLY